ncbi:hypothetical protein [Mesorhizobium sp. Root157]|uniref:hypothetical protein n=1 Tax=Mesorhizobium sp. Root157 TaxID=1736477 RepID=UPI000AE026CC|nr:hypothetical protein [Mesorhizobium sp. Root157]
MTITTDEPIRDMTGRPVTVARPRLGRRITWAELYKERPDLRPANQNDRERDAA